MLKIVCVNADNYLGRGKQYVEILYDSVIRNLPENFPGQFICFTDDVEPYHPGIIKKPLHGQLNGWWNKLYLFKEGLFNDGDRIIYFDLDTCITGTLEEIVKYDGDFAILRDVYRPEGLGSGIMMWGANKASSLWESFEAARYPNITGGDQAWIEEIVFNPDIIQEIFPGDFCSYKVSARNVIPPGTKVVFFHGLPRPHECSGWVEHVWKIGGGLVSGWKTEGNTGHRILQQNVRNALNMGAPLLDGSYIQPKDDILLICGGGPSLEDDLAQIRIMKKFGSILWALNNTFKYLTERGIEPDCHVMLDARYENIEFVPHKTEATLLYSAQCHPHVLEKAQYAGNLILWIPPIPDILEMLREYKKSASLVCHGSSVGILAMGLAYVSGYRNVHLYGYDSSYRDGKNHAYPQALNDRENTVDITFKDRVFHCATWMASQAEEFRAIIPEFLEKGMQFSVHGDGLIPCLAEDMCNT